MQIDFHHGVTYVLARLAGLPRPAAGTVAYAAQYVDDATSSGTLRFDNGARFGRVPSAHKLLDYRNFEELANHRVWVPFHFLPGNSGAPAGVTPPGSYVERLICRPDSPVARALLRDTIAGRGAPYALHRLGVTMHVYADTWAHQGFAGVNDQANAVSDVVGEDGKPDLDLKSRLTSFFIGEALPIGHGAALSYPDRPWLVWGYTSGLGQQVHRDNTAIFLDAAEHLLVAMRRYIAGSADAHVDGLAERDRDVMARLFRQLRDPDGEKRHATWMQAIADGEFSFGREPGVGYIAEGRGSWKHLALGAEEEADDESKDRFAFHPDFLKSDWKRFHDAVQVFRTQLLVETLPSFGLCAA